MLDNDLIFYGMVILLFLLISAFFSAAETAMTAVTRARLYQMVMDGNKRAQLVSRLRREKESLIGTVLLSNNAINIAASAIATSLAIRIFGNNDGALAWATLVMTVLVVVLAEILPKTYAIQNAERVALALAPTLHIMVKLLYPITRAIQVFIRALLKLFGIDITRSDTLISVTDIIRGTIEMHHKEGRMVKQERDMLGSILDLHEMEVRDIMIHRTHVETLNADLPADALVQSVVATMHSRIPLWRGQPDNIIGLLHVKNLIQILQQQPGNIDSARIIAGGHKPWFIPETTSLRDQLLAFRHRRQHFAFVVDEYGGWQGIVTLEDIIEEIVGDINDEHDEMGRDVQKVGDKAYVVAGSVPVRDLNRQLEWDLPDDTASTIAGLLIHECEIIPEIGEYFDLHGFRFTVMDKAAMQITKLRIERLPDAQLTLPEI